LKKIGIDIKENQESVLLKAYKLYYQDLFNYGLRIARNEEIVRDSIHDLFVQLWPKSLDRITNHKPYLLKALRYIIIDSLKAKKDSALVKEMDGISLSTEDIIINEEISKETGAKIRAALSLLSARQKEVIYLRFYSGLNYEEISEIIGINNQSVRNLFSTAMKELRGQMIPALIISAVFQF
jgi:RNA polymerase sigma factor (sigma-70 family)